MSKPIPLITTKEAAAYLSLKPATLIRYRWQGIGPKYIRPGGGRAVRYSLTDLDAWIAANTVAGSVSGVAA